MKKHIIDIAPTPASIAAALAHFQAIRAELAHVLHSLGDGDRVHHQKLGPANEAWCMEVVEAVRQHPKILPVGMSLAAIQRDIAAREMIRPLLDAAREITRLLEDTFIMLGVDIFNDARGFYKHLQILAEFGDLEETVAKLKAHYARPTRGKKKETTTGATAANLSE